MFAYVTGYWGRRGVQRSYRFRHQLRRRLRPQTWLTVSILLSGGNECIRCELLRSMIMGVCQSIFSLC